MKEVIERCNWLVNKCKDKAITPDVKDDIGYLLEEIERLNNIINDLYNGLEQIIEQGYDYSEKDFIAGKLQDKIKELKGDSSNE